MFFTMLLTIVAGMSVPMIEPPHVTITAACGGGTPESFGTGAMAREFDGAVFPIEPGSIEPGRKVVHNATFVTRLNEKLQSVGFDNIELDRSDGPWCGVTRTIESSSREPTSSSGGVRNHSVRWPTRVLEGGSLAHDFAGVPVEVWHVFLELQRVGVDHELCGAFHDELLTQWARDGAIWIACQGPGIVPPAAGVYVLSDGDILTWSGSPVMGGRCARIVGNDAVSLKRWNAMLSEARFERLSDRPDSARYGNVNCSIGRLVSKPQPGPQMPHVIGLTPVALFKSRDVPSDPRWNTVERVFTEIGSMFPPDDRRLVPALRKAMSQTNRKDRP